MQLWLPATCGQYTHVLRLIICKPSYSLNYKPWTLEYSVSHIVQEELWQASSWLIYSDASTGHRGYTEMW